MATTLSYGYVKPQDGDRGSTFWDDLADDIQQLNDHTHDGLNSSLIPSSSIVATVGDVLAASWVSSGSGYRQLVTVPAGFDVDTTDISFRNASGGAAMYLNFEKVSDATYYVYINDNSVSLKAVYTT